MAPQFPFKPMQDQVVVLPDPQPTRYGTLYLPDNTRVSSATKSGTVVRVGMGKQTPKGVIKVQLKTGDRVVFGEFAGQEFVIGTKRFLVMREEEVIGVLLNEDTDGKDDAQSETTGIKTDKIVNDPSIFSKKLNREQLN